MRPPMAARAPAVIPTKGRETTASETARRLTTTAVKPKRGASDPDGDKKQADGKRDANQADGKRDGAKKAGGNQSKKQQQQNRHGKRDR